MRPHHDKGSDRVSDLFSPEGHGPYVRLIVGKEGEEQEPFNLPIEFLTKHSSVFAAMFQRRLWQVRILSYALCGRTSYHSRTVE